jgi:hypothetical protein
MRSITSESKVFPISKKGILFGKEGYAIPWMNHVIPGYSTVVDHSHLYLGRWDWEEIKNFA